MASAGSGRSCGFNAHGSGPAPMPSAECIIAHRTRHADARPPVFLFFSVGTTCRPYVGIVFAGKRTLTRNLFVVSHYRLDQHHAIEIKNGTPGCVKSEVLVNVTYPADQIEPAIGDQNIEFEQLCCRGFRIMPFEYTLSSDKTLLTIRGAGGASMADRHSCVQKILKDSTLPSSCDIVIDVDNVSGAPSSSELREIAYLIDVLHKRFAKRVAILNGRVGHVTTSQVIALLTESASVRAFLTVDEMKEWLSTE
jgi:hypothetical protein